MNDVHPNTRRELEALLTEFAFRADHGLGSTLHELFTEDGSISGPGLDMQGRDDIARQFAKRAENPRRVSRHQWSNPRFEKLAEDLVRVRTVVQTHIHELAEGEAKPVARWTQVVGDSVDVVCRASDGRWRFRSRELVVAFRGSGGGQ